MPQLNEDSNDYLFQQDGCLAHYHKDVRGYLNQILSQRWIGSTGQEDDALIQWSPRSPELTPWGFLSWEFVKDTVFVPPSPANLRDLHNRITAAVALVNHNMLTPAWDKMDYRIDVCRISKSSVNYEFISISV
jgi:hypothetical protein